VREQVGRHSGAEDGDLAHALYIGLVEEHTGCHAPVTDLRVVRIDTVDHRAPVALAAHYLEARHDHRRYGGQQRALSVDCVDVIDGQPIERLRTLAHAAGL